MLDNKDNLYFYSKKEKEVYLINKEDPERWLNYLYRLYGLNTQSRNDKFIVSEIKEFGRENAEEIEINNTFKYDEENNLLYVFDRNKHYYKLNGEEITKHPNGEQGIYFRKEKSMDGEINYIPREDREEIEILGEIDEFEGQGNVFKRVLANRTNFEYKTALTKEQQRKQLLFQLYCILFKDVLNSKPVIFMVGPKGSGKSVTLNMLGKFFMNPKFKVSSLRDEQDFIVAVVNKTIHFLDNVDSPPSWFADALAKIATGAQIDQRKLYENLTNIVARPSCFLGVTSRTPKFKRDDVVDRGLIFHVKRFNSNYPENLLYKPLKKKEEYDVIWSCYLDNLNQIVEWINQNKDFMKQETDHRLADWAIFTEAIANALDIEGREKLLNDMQEERATFSLEGDPLKQAIEEWLRSEEYKKEYLTAAELLEELGEINEGFGKSYKRPQSLGRRLSNVEAELNELYGLKTKEDSHNERKMYYFDKEQAKLVFDDSLSQDERIKKFKQWLSEESNGSQEGVDKSKCIDKLEELDSEDPENDLEHLEEDEESIREIISPAGENSIKPVFS